MTPCTIRKEFEEFKEFRSSGVQEFRSSGVQEFRSSGVQEFRSSAWEGLENCKKKPSVPELRIQPALLLRAPELLNFCNS
jgi:hypothetical protein